MHKYVILTNFITRSPHLMQTIIKLVKVCLLFYENVNFSNSSINPLGALRQSPEICVQCPLA
jgi:hypothetical protein